MQNTQFPEIQIANALQIAPDVVQFDELGYFAFSDHCTVTVGNRALDCGFDAIGLCSVLDARTGDLVWRRNAV